MNIRLLWLLMLMVVGNGDIRLQKTCPLLATELDQLDLIEDKFLGFRRTLNNRYHSLLHMKNREETLNFQLNELQ
jgi:hypothetical protein